jgi:hypothetical protein
MTHQPTPTAQPDDRRWLIVMLELERRRSAALAARIDALQVRR